MFERRSSRFAIEVLVLVALAVSVAVAHLNRALIGGVMLAGWLIVSLLEWASLRGEAHYGSGMPPRYYQPQVRLPPPRPIAESPVRYAPQVSAEAPTRVVAPPVPTVAVAAPEPVFVAPEPPVVAPLEPAFVPEPEPALEPVLEVAIEEPAVAASDDQSELLGGVELGSAMEFGHAPDEQEPVAGLDLRDDSPFDVWQDAPASEPEPVVEVVEAVAEEPIADIVPDLWPELPASWFAQAGDAPAAEAEPDPEPAEPEPAEPEFDPMPLVADVTRDEPELAHWFDTQLPGTPAELEPGDLQELPVWAFLDTNAEHEDELAAQEILAEEIEPLLDVPLGEPLPEEADVTSWFDTPGTGLVYAEQNDAEEPEHPTRGVDVEAAPVSTGPSGSSFAPGPLLEVELPQSDLELDILIGRLAGVQLGEDKSLMSWFDAQLPGAVTVAQTEPSLEKTAVAEPEDDAVGGWLLEADAQPEDTEVPSVNDAWDREITVEGPTGSDLTARHSIDPLAPAGDGSSRRFGRKHPENQGDTAGSVEVPARPAGRLLLPSRPKRDT